MSARYEVRCTVPGCGWIGTRTGEPADVTAPCPHCGPLERMSQTTVVVDHPIGGSS